MNVNYYLDQPFNEGNSPEEKVENKLKLKALKAVNKAIPANLYNPKETAIYIYIWIGDKTIKIKTGQRIRAKDWDFDSQQVKKSYTGSPEFNEYLIKLRSDILTQYRLMATTNASITLDEVREAVLTIMNGKQAKDTQKEFLEAFNQFISTKITDKHELTIKKYNTLLKHLQKFQQYQKCKLTFETIDLRFYELFKAYLIKEARHTNNTIGKYISTLKTFLHWASDHELNAKKDYIRFKVPSEKVDIVCLMSASPKSGPMVTGV